MQLCFCSIFSTDKLLHLFSEFTLNCCIFCVYVFGVESKQTAFPPAHRDKTLLYKTITACGGEPLWLQATLLP